MVKTRADPRQRDEGEERPKRRRERDEEGTEAQDRDADREKTRRITSICHDTEQELEDGRYEERGTSEQGDLDGSEAAEDGLEDSNLTREDRDGSVVRQVVDRIREQDATFARHTSAIERLDKALAPRARLIRESPVGTSK